MEQTEKILHIERDITWLPQPNEAQLVQSTILPPLALTTTAFALAFSGEQLLLTNLARRGWDLPGGHVESDETAEQTAVREVYEETGASLGPLHLLGYQHLRLLGPKPKPYKYPYPDAYQVFFWAHINALDDFTATDEALERGLFSRAEALAVRWVRKNSDLYQLAFDAATKS